MILQSGDDVPDRVLLDQGWQIKSFEMLPVCDMTCSKEGYEFKITIGKKGKEAQHFTFCSWYNGAEWWTTKYPGHIDSPYSKNPDIFMEKKQCQISMVGKTETLMSQSGCLKQKIRRPEMKLVLAD